MGPAPGSPYVAVDAGSVFTKAYLLDEVEGERRLVAVGRVPSDGDDGYAAWAAAEARAVSQALAIGGYPPDRTLAAATLDARLPRILVASAREEDARESVEQLERLPLRVVERVTLAGGGAERLLNAVEVLAPDAVVLVSSGDARAADGRAVLGALEALRFSGASPFVVLVGDPDASGAAAALLDGTRHALVPATEGTALTDALASLVERSSLDGVRAGTEIIAERYDVDVLTLDLGASHALAVLASGTTGRRRVVAIARDDLGLRRGRPGILERAGAEALQRWLPIDLDGDALRTDARRGLIAPAALPETPEELLLDHAFAREALRLLLADMPKGVASGAAGLPPVDLLIGSGGVLAGAPRLSQAAMILLDAVQPEALTQIALDRATALPLLGHLGSTDGHTNVGAALERDGLLNLGLCIAPIGSGREGETAVRVEVAFATRSPVTVEVPYGAVEVVPLGIGERASLKLWPSRDFDVGLGRGNAATPRAEVEGGAVGIIIDARGRPLSLPDGKEKRQAKLLQWLQATRAYPQLSFVQADAVHTASTAETTLRGEEAG